MSMYIEVCHCGHDRVSHFECKHTCLGMHCECRMYIHRDDPDRAERMKDPNAPKPWTDAERDLPTPVIHPVWCTCPDCYPAGP